MTSVNHFLGLTLRIAFPSQEPSHPRSLPVAFRVLGLRDALWCGFRAPGERGDARLRLQAMHTLELARII